MTQIASIVFKPAGVDEPDDDFLRVDLEEATLIAGHGIEGDLKAGHPTRQLCLLSYETLTNLRGQGAYTEPGQMGEQLVIHQLDVDNLPVGARLQLGPEAVIEVTGPREPCDRLGKMQRKPKVFFEGLAGVMAKVIVGGSIRVGHPVRVLEHV
jgi:MOSC domain-containing protein YiiM